MSEEGRGLTEIERHVLDAVAHLRNGRDSRQGFNQTIDLLLTHGRALELRCEALAKENRELRHQMAIPLPRLDMNSYEVLSDNAFEWRMERLTYRVWGHDFQLKADPRFWARIKKQSYCEILREFRKGFEETFHINEPRARRRAG